MYVTFICLAQLSMTDNFFLNKYENKYEKREKKTEENDLC